MEMECDHRSITRAVNLLLANKVLIQVGDNLYSFNKDYEKWGVQPPPKPKKVGRTDPRSGAPKPQGGAPKPQNRGLQAPPIMNKERNKPLKKERPVSASNGSRKLSPNQEYVERFKACYESVTKQPYKWDRHHFVIADKLIKSYGYDTVVEKTKILGVMCRDQSVWFTKDGWASFSIEKLSRMWNSILPKHIVDPDQKKRDEFMQIKEKVRAEHERLNTIANTARRN